MADYPQLKTITLDGITMGMKEGLGVPWYYRNERIGAVDSDTWYDGISAPIPEAGTYLAIAIFGFPGSSQTGAVSHRCRLTMPTTTFYKVDHDAIQGDVIKQVVGIQRYATYDANRRVSTGFQTNRPISANRGLYTILYVTKLLDIYPTS